MNFKIKPLTYHSTMMRCKLFSLYLNFFLFHEWFNVFTLFASRSMFVHKEEMVKWIWTNRCRLTQLIAVPTVRHGLTTKFDNQIILKKGIQPLYPKYCYFNWDSLTKIQSRKIIYNSAQQHVRSTIQDKRLTIFVIKPKLSVLTND